MARSLKPEIHESEAATKHAGLVFERMFTHPGVDPLSEVDWERRSAIIAGEDGRVVFEQHEVEVPREWSQTATNVVVSKYFRGGSPGHPQRETSMRQLVARVVDTIGSWGEKQHYFASRTDCDSFKAELSYLLIHQLASFNSPVYFNVGIEPRPQCSACFILKVEDSMESILNWYRNEGMIFKGGSGSGVNLSDLRSCHETLSSGGTASGPLSFKSGGCVRGRYQVRREDAAGSQNGGAQRHASGRRRFHQMQAGRREKGVGADRSRLRLVAGRFSV
jgi:ribonucleoside-diphosphate reductase alpha chain